MQRRLPCLLLLTAVLGGCDGAREETPAATTPMPATLAGVYSGQFPCSNCAAIAATLWLRADGRFFLRQRFGDDDTKSQTAGANEESMRYSLGRWRWDEVAGEAILSGAGPERHLIVRDDGGLQMRVNSPIEHVLARDASSPRFGDRVTLDGESAVTDKSATFRECRTGLQLTVADAGAYRELRQKHRRMNPRGKVALTTIEGHLVGESTTSERLVVDRFISIKPGQGC